MKRGKKMPEKEKIKQFIVNDLILDDSGINLTDTTPLIDSGVVDSLGIMKLLGFLENDFLIKISGDDLIPDNFATINAINDLVKKKKCLISC